MPLRYAMCNEVFRGWPQERIFRFLAECGYQGVEIAPFTIHRDVTQISASQRKTLRKQADAAKIRVIGLHWLLAKTQGFHLTHPDGAVRRHTAEYLCELARFCRDLGGELLVFGSPKQRDLPPGISRQLGMRYACDVLRQVIPTLEKLGVILALEPLSPRTTNFLRTAAEAVELIQKVDSPACQLHLDCNAMASESVPIPELIRRNARWLVHFHANDPNGRGPGMGELDFVPIFQALREIGYRGWISVEVFDVSPGPERTARESLHYMKQVEKKVG
ncbi:MAG: sugar phosphate isomerase/epimerase [Planctomycetes bacterium]|nr:sugar phosphate isomerase/epimerase [Planctomycetota bacterium]